MQPYQHHSGGAFEVHAYTQPVGQSAIGAMTVVFTIASATGVLANNTAGGQTAITLNTTLGSSYTQIQAAAALYGSNPVFTVISALDVATGGGSSRVNPGNSIAFTSATAGTWGVAPTAYSSQDVRVVAIWDPNQAYTDPVTGGSLGFQQQNPDGSGTALVGGVSTALTSTTGAGYTQSINPINVYSFSLAPEEHQPSGSCNFSRIDTTTLVFDSITGVDGKALVPGSYPSKSFPYLFRMYAVNYNIFRVMSGMGGLAYSN